MKVARPIAERTLRLTEAADEEVYTRRLPVGNMRGDDDENVDTAVN